MPDSLAIDAAPTATNCARCLTPWETPFRAVVRYVAWLDSRQQLVTGHVGFTVDRLST